MIYHVQHRNAKYNAKIVIWSPATCDSATNLMCLRCEWIIKNVTIIQNSLEMSTVIGDCARWFYSVFVLQSCHFILFRLKLIFFWKIPQFKSQKRRIFEAKRFVWSSHINFVQRYRIAMLWPKKSVHTNFVTNCASSKKNSIEFLSVILTVTSFTLACTPFQKWRIQTNEGRHSNKISD